MLIVLRTLIQPRMYYYSQFWSPRDRYSINLLESNQKFFISQVKGPALKEMTYWQKLSEPRVSSQEQRRERDQICFLWKLSQGLIKGFEIKWQWSDRRGGLAVHAIFPNNAATNVKRAKKGFLNAHGTRLFSLLPKSLRNENSADFRPLKNHMVIFLARISDKPTMAG